MKKDAVVVHSGGMDSSICLAIAIKEFGKENVLSMTFSYNQRNETELNQAKKICSDWDVDHTVIHIDCLSIITENAMTNKNLSIEIPEHSPPNTLVDGRNGLMARLAAIHANHLLANVIYMGVIEVESANSGYRDCTRKYMDMMQEILRIDFANPDFEIRTPVVNLTKKETLELADQLGILGYLLKNTITCYEGIPHKGCGICPSCLLRNEGIKQYQAEHPDYNIPYAII